MINQQLVEYIKQQLQAGVQKDTVRKALTDAGWAAADIDDSMKAAEPAGVVSAATITGGAVGAMSGSQPAAMTAARSASINPAVAMGDADGALRSEMDKSGSSQKFFSQSATMQTKPVLEDEDDDQPSAKKFMVALISMGAVILLLAGALAFVYFNMSGRLAAAPQGNAGDSAQLSNLQTQVAQLTKDKNDLTTQMQTLATDNQSLLAELSFFAPAASATSTAPVSATIKGSLSGTASTTFVLMTPHNVKIFVANSKDAKVGAALTPLANGTAPVTLMGTHVPASPNFTVTSVNGTEL